MQLTTTHKMDLFSWKKAKIREIVKFNLAKINPIKVEINITNVYTSLLFDDSLLKL